MRPLYNILGAALHRSRHQFAHRQNCGTEAALSQHMWKSCGLTCGIAMASRCWKLLQARLNSSHRWWRNGSQKNAGCGGHSELKCASQILVQSANPRSNHTTRTLPPSQSSEYARRHDEGMWATLQALLKEVLGSEHELRSAEQVRHSPCAWGMSPHPCALAPRTGFVVGRPSHNPTTHASSG